MKGQDRMKKQDKKDRERQDRTGPERTRQGRSGWYESYKDRLEQNNRTGRCDAYSGSEEDMMKQNMEGQ